MWLWIGIIAGAIVVIACAGYVFYKKSSSDKSICLEDIIGEKCTVIDDVDNYKGSGLVKVGNQIWAARAVSDDEIYAVGDVISVVAIEGVKLICRK